MMSTLLVHQHSDHLQQQPPATPAHRNSYQKHRKTLTADKKRIKLANAELMKGQMRCSDRTMLSAPEKKQCNIFVADDNLKSCLSIGEYVKVVADTSPGTNRPERCGWIRSVRYSVISRKELNILRLIGASLAT